MSQHHFPAQSSVLGKVAVLVGFSPRCHGHFTRVIVNDEPHHSADDLPDADAVRADLQTVGVNVPPSVLDAITKDQIDFCNGVAHVGRRLFEYNPLGRLVHQGSW